ncbi:MAG: ribonuclease R [bacterium]
MPTEDPPSGFRPADESGIPVPSRILLLQFLTDCKRPVAAGEIRDHFEIAGEAAAEALRGRLERMRAQGLVLRDRKGRYALPQKMDIVSGRVSGHANGYGFVIPDDGSGDLFLHHRQMRKVLHGDRVLARLKQIDQRGRKEGVVIEVLVEPKREIVGHFHLESGAGFVEPDDSRFARDITIPGDARHGAQDGDIVAARIVRHPVEHRHAVGEIVEVLGKHLTSGMETEIAIRKHSIPVTLPASAQAELEAMADDLRVAAPQPGRRDLRDLPLVTIDGADARDFDDAVYCEREQRGERRDGGWRLVVAIADVGHYVRVGGALDREAHNRGNSVYFPNRVVPMLPRELSNGICSLNPNADRYCMACDIRLDAGGEIVDYEFYPALMHSHARLTYDAMNQVVVRRDSKSRAKWSRVAPHLDDLYALYQALIAQRRARGTIDFEFPEPLIEFDANQKIRRISIRERNDAHRLIEECMLTANVCAARYLQQHLGNRAIYRNHGGPDRDSLLNLRRFLAGLGLQIGGGAQPQAGDYARLVETAAAKPQIAAVVQSALLRSLSQASYGTEPAGHFALAYPAYTHFTSPIRRYSDLMVHRQIRMLLDGRQSARDKELARRQSARDEELARETGQGAREVGNLERIAERCSFTERRADDATRDAIAWLKAEFMQDKVGEVFDGVISGVKEFGVFVQLDDLFVDGLVHVTALGDDYYHFDPLHFRLVGERSNKTFRLGDRLRVRVARVVLDDAKIDFELCDDGGQAASNSGKKRKKRGKKSSKRRGKKRGKKG